MKKIGLVLLGFALGIATYHLAGDFVTDQIDRADAAADAYKKGPRKVLK